MSVAQVELCAGGPRLSRLVQGYWRLADWKLPAQERVRFIEAHLAQGIDAADHADIYGDYRCEALFGEALALDSTLRDRLRIVSKCGIALVSPGRPGNHVKHYDSSPAHIAAAVEGSLRALHTDRLDLLLLHRPDPLMDADATARALTDLVAAGKVLAVGVSNFTPAQFSLLQSRLELPLATNQVEINPLHPAVLFDGTLDQAQRLQRRPMAWSPLAGGRAFSGQDEHARRLRACLDEISARSGHTASQLLLAWVLALPSQPLVVLGSGRISRLHEAVGALDVALSRADWFRILEAARGHAVA